MSSVVAWKYLLEVFYINPAFDYNQLKNQQMKPKKDLSYPKLLQQISVPSSDIKQETLRFHKILSTFRGSV